MTSESLTTDDPLDGQDIDENVLLLDRVAGDALSVASLRSPLTSYDFSTAGLARGDQFAMWHDNFAPMVELSEIAPRTATFTGRQKLWDLGSLVLAEIDTDRLAFSSLPGHVRRDPVDHWTMTVLLNGKTHTQTTRDAFSGGPGEVQIHSLGRSFDGVVAERSKVLILFVPRDLSFEIAATLGSAEFSTIATGMGRLFSDYLVDVAHRLPMLAQADLPSLAGATRAMILACVSPSTDHADAAKGPIANVLRERARRLVHARLLDPKLSSELVRKELGVSRTRLYNLFEPLGGVMHYIQHRRLLSAYAALTDPSDRRLIFQIAEERGFSDGAEFGRAFKRTFGYSPSEVRNSGGGGMPLRSHLADCPSVERLGLLLRLLQG
ncbi:AraC family transcriptional regulator [Rhizobium grahamii]|uniref:AraC family transcriptional regulator n=2 Tax=Rhizobium grahamii TaxID=1120045 RepID=A0A370KG93_9HYPH|nr:AraC family transcriptional regulator [Rhizobium grahamii]